MGSINVEKLYDEKTKDINWTLFEYVIKMGIRFLDDIIDINEYVLPEFKENVLGNRKIGLGIAGWANLLIKMGIRYDSNKCLNFIDRVFSFKQKIEKEYNTELGLEKGNFLNWNESIYAKTNTPARCSAISTQAPTGSISSILNTTAYGIEPHFGVAYKRRIITGEIYEANDLFTKMLHGIINDETKEQKIIKECYEKGTAQINSVPKQLKELFRCANDISSDWHIKIQAQFQKYYDNAISKTINAPENATKDELFDLLIKAWELDIKGVTYYRNNSRKNQTIQIGKSKESNDDTLKRGQIIKAPTEADGKTYKFVSGCGNVYLNVTYDKNGNINQTFTNKGSSGTCRSNQEAVSRLVSLSLRGGISIDEVIDQLKSVDTCPAYVSARKGGKKVSKGSSCPNAIAYILERAKGELKNKNVKVNVQDIQLKQEESHKENINHCPECGEEIILIEGCVSCKACGWSRCS